MNICYELYRLKDKIPKNTYKAILGQIRAGDYAGAAVGIESIKKKIKV